MWKLQIRRGTLASSRERFWRSSCLQPSSRRHRWSRPHFIIPSSLMSEYLVVQQLADSKGPKQTVRAPWVVSPRYRTQQVLLWKTFINNLQATSILYLKIHQIMWTILEPSCKGSLWRPCSIRNSIRCLMLLTSLLWQGSKIQRWKVANS